MGDNFEGLKKTRVQLFSVKGFFDGNKINLSEKIEVKTPQNVIVVFLGEAEKYNDEIYQLAEKGKAFDFLNDPCEDIYSDNDLKVKY